jgi:hypothetical protein
MQNLAHIQLHIWLVILCQQQQQGRNGSFGHHDTHG